MICCDHVGQHVNRVTTRHLMKPHQIVPSVFPELQQEISPVAAVREMVTKRLGLVTLSSSHALPSFRAVALVAPDNSPDTRIYTARKQQMPPYIA
jgi:hypothetical protein